MAFPLAKKKAEYGGIKKLKLEPVNLDELFKSLSPGS
jgi:preprotein translocase subunit SecB